ncbi:MAG TPA: hypothetical protein VEI01_14250 [Terriglobales bacterium]|nr:hypothetical protein [Terriglobales bacterium]
MIRLTKTMGGLLLAMTTLVSAQLKLPKDVEMTGSVLGTMGYAGSNGDFVQSNHSLQFGFSGIFNGFYYNPNFLNFSVLPYYNQSQANSSSASLSNSSGVNATANFFTGSHFPGSVSYNYSYNSSQNIGLPNAPAFTSVGTSQGFGIGWSALLPGWPTLSVNYSQGSGNGEIYGTHESTQSSSRTFGVRSNYQWEGFNLNASYLRQSLHLKLPNYLGGPASNSDNHGDTIGLGASHNLPWNGQMFVNYTWSSFANDYEVPESVSNSSYTTNNETAAASFHPTIKLTLSVNESYADNLSGYLLQNSETAGVIPPPVNFGSSSNSFTVGGGAGYQITRYLFGSAQATYYDQSYFGATHTGTFLSGTLNYWRRLWNTFSFSAGFIDYATGQGTSATGASINGEYHNSVGLVGTVNAARRIRGWELNGAFSYIQNVQSQLITYTVSTYAYNANIHRRFSNRVQWTAAFSGSHSGFTQEPNTANHGESYSTSLYYKRIGLSGVYSNNTGVSLFGSGGLVPLPPVPGQPNPNLVYFSGTSYGGSVSFTPLRRMTVSTTYNRSLSNTVSNLIPSRNNMDLLTGQLQYRFRKIQLQAGYYMLTQGISASGAPPGTVTSYFAGVSRWFDLF